VIVDSPIVPMPDKLVEFIRMLARKHVEEINKRVSTMVLSGTDEEKLNQLRAQYPDDCIPHGSHDNTLTSIAGKLRQVLKMDAEQMKPILVEFCERCCAGRGGDYIQMCEKIAKSVGRYEIKSSGEVFISGGTPVSPEERKAQRAAAAALSKATIESWLPDESTVARSNDEVFQYVAMLPPADYET
jgi:hypothetical protein